MNLKENLCTALASLGADTSRYQFDDHSTIVMSFDDIGDIYLDPQHQGEVWMWGRINELSDSARDALAAPLLGELVRPASHWMGGAMLLREDGRVGGLLHDDCLQQPERLATALQDFHQTLLRLQALR